jgi:subtilisin family serine protease
LGVVELVAPGGDRRFQVTPDAPNGRVLSTFPIALFDSADPLMTRDCSISPCATYAYLQGTSMAGPHVAGVAALVISQHKDADPEDVTDILLDSADEVPCPPNPFNPGPPFDFVATCEGSPENNSFFGYGQVNALNALTNADGDGEGGEDDDNRDNDGDDDDRRDRDGRRGGGRRDDD